MKKRFFKVGETYIAIHYAEKKIYLVEDSTEELKVSVWYGEAKINYINSYKGKPIDEALFTGKFSGAIEKLHNNTPYA